MNKYEEFSLLITIVTELFFAGREKMLMLGFSFLLYQVQRVFSCTILLLYNSKTHPEVQWLVEDFLLRLSSFPMVSPENVSHLHFLS